MHDAFSPTDEPPQDPRFATADPAAREAGANQAFGMACHLSALLTYVFENVWFNLAGLLAPVILWQLLEGRRAGAARSAKEAFQFQLNILGWLMLASLLRPLCGIGHALRFVVHGANIALSLAAAVRTGEGARYRYPAIVRILD